MSTETLFTAGSEGLVPKADAARQAVDSLRGYAYQVTAAALAWLDIDERARIFLEVAEDYATVADGALKAVQVKDTQASAHVTLNTEAVRDAIANFIALVEANPNTNVSLEYFTTSNIGTERPPIGCVSGEPGLLYWRIAAKSSDLTPLRNLLESDKFSDSVRAFVKCRDDEQLRHELLRKIHWNCGKPDLASLRREFQERLVVIGRDRFQVPATEISKVANVLLYHVLEKSLRKTPSERALTRADLISTIDGTTRVSVSRAMLEMRLVASAGFGGLPLGSTQSSFSASSGLPAWLVDGDALPKPRRLLPRAQIESKIEEKLRKFGTCFITGASGVGKTNVAQSIAENLSGSFVVADFRNVAGDEVVSRLSILLSRLGDLRAQTIILEDLNCINYPHVDLAMAQIFEAISRRDMFAIVTCYTLPAVKVLTTIGIGQYCSQPCPYFSEEEATRLAQLHGGNAKTWGKLAYISGAFGHPQLVHAFIAGMAARGWPTSEVSQILSTGLSSGDVDAERDAARRALATTLPANARELLYRLSLLIGQFDRHTALSLAETPPPLGSPGEQLDALVGPWLEDLGRGRYRVSPLAAKFGQEMIPPALQTEFHSAIAKRLISFATIDVSDIDKIFTHALAGKNVSVLTSISTNLVSADEKVLKFLAENSSLFHILTTEKAIYPDNLVLSGMLRLAQFKIIATSKDKKNLAACVRALFGEINQQTKNELQSMFRLACLGTILSVTGIANYLNDWFELLQECRKLTSDSPALARLTKDSISGFSSDGLVPFFFAIGSTELMSIAELERIFDKLDAVPRDERIFFLSVVSQMAPDFSVFVNSPWLSVERNSLDYADAAERYKRMALKTAHWDIRPLTLQCWIARAIMFDEYGSDREGALQALDEAITAHGDDVLLARARAKVFWRAQDHAMALGILRGIADTVGRDNPVERAFALREAAISAAKTGDWGQAEAWFLEGREAALVAKSSDMKVMASGLEADAAVAAFRAGQRKQSLRLVGSALTEIEGVDSKSSLRAAYSHHVVRHIVLWLMSQIEGTPFEVDGLPIAMEPGCCSNPEPHASFAQRPLGSADIVWYMLAQMDVGCRADLGYAPIVQQRMATTSIPTLEFGLRTKYLMRSIQDLDHESFAEYVQEYVACGVGSLSYMRRVGKNFDALEPDREAVPQLTLEPLSQDAKALINGAVLAFAIGCACRNSAELIPVMQSTVIARLGQKVANATALSLVGEEKTSNRESKFEAQLIKNLLAFNAHNHSTPMEYCVAAVRSVQQADASHLKQELIPMIAAWQRAAWTRIIATETFQLARPRLSVPDIEAALSLPKDDDRFLCSLILAITAATDVNLPQEMRSSYRLRASAKES